MIDQEYILTPEGIEKIKKDLSILINIKRKEIIDRIERAKELGDLSENAEYSQARDEQSFIEGKISDLKHILNHATVATKDENNKVVQMGSKVTTKYENCTKEFQIVGINEVNPLEGKISNESPLGKALLSKKTGDEIEINTPKGTSKYRIEEIK